MKYQKYNRIITDLNKNIKENNQQIDEETCRKDALMNSRNAERIIGTLGLSFIPCFGMNIAIGSMYKSGIINIPSILSAGIITVGSLVSGEIFNRMITKKSRKNIAENKYTEAEICEEIIKLKMEIEKLKIENKITKSVIGKLQESEQAEEAMARLAKELDAKIQVTVSEDSGEYLKKINKLKQELESKYALLYEITKKNVLYEEHGNINNKATIVSISTLAGTLATCYVCLPILFRNMGHMNEFRTPFQALITLLTPLIIGTTACASILNKRNKHLKAALNNLESQLPSNQKVDEKSIEDLINEISEIEFNLHQQKAMFDAVEENKKPKYEYKFDENYYKTDLQPCETEEQLQQNSEHGVLVYKMKN